MIEPYNKILRALNLEKHLTGRQIARLIYPQEYASDTKNRAYQRVMKNLKTLEKENLLRSKDYERGTEKFWSLAKNKEIKNLGYEPPQAEIHRFKYEHEKGCGDIFVSFILTEQVVLWEGEGRAIRGFRHDRKFAFSETWYLENERGTQAPKILRGKLENYLHHYRETGDVFHVLFVVKDEASLVQIVSVFDEYKLPNRYWAVVFDELVSDPLNARITSRNNTATLANF